MPDDLNFGEESQTEILQLSDEAFDEMLQGKPIGPKGKPAPAKGATASAKGSEDLPADDEVNKRYTEIGTFDDVDLDQDLKGAKKKSKVKAEKEEEEEDDDEDEKDIKKKKVSDDEDDDDAEEDDDDEDEKKVPKKKVAVEEDDDTNEDDDPDEEEIKRGTVLKNVTDYLIEQGHWFDFKGREELETIDSKTFGKLILQQDQARVHNLFEEMVDQSGPVGKAIFNHISNGGDPEDVIDIFKEQKKVEAIDITTEEGQKDMIRTHLLSEGRGEQYITKFLKRVEDADDLEAEAKSAQELLKKRQDRELAEINQHTAAQRQLAEQQNQQYVAAITEAINARKDLTIEERKLIRSKITDYNIKIGGRTVNGFYVDFQKIQQNPQEYIDLVMFVTDKKKYLARVTQPKKNVKVDQEWDFIRNNAKAGKKGDRDLPVVKKKQAEKEFDFGA